MIKMTATSKEGRHILVLGLEEMNIVRMREGKPVQINGEEFGWPNCEIWIVLGNDEKELVKMFSPMIGPNTTIRDNRQEKKQ